MNPDDPRLIKTAVYYLYQSIAMLKKAGIDPQAFIQLATEIWGDPGKFFMELRKWRP